MFKLLVQFLLASLVAFVVLVALAASTASTASTERIVVVNGERPTLRECQTPADRLFDPLQEPAGIVGQDQSLAAAVDLELFGL